MIRILFLDTSALLSFFISDKGTPTMRWLISSENKAHNTTRYVINNQVIREFEESLKILVEKDDIKKATADSILELFNTHYKGCKFKITGKDASIKETMDGMYNFMGRLTQPILVTCNTEQVSYVNEYQTINPQTQTTVEIELALRGKKKPQEDNARENTGNERINSRYFYRRFFKKSRMTLAV